MRDTGCTLKAMRRECREALVPFRGMHRFIPALVKGMGYKLTEIPGESPPPAPRGEQIQIRQPRLQGHRGHVRRPLAAEPAIEVRRARGEGDVAGGHAWAGYQLARMLNRTGVCRSPVNSADGLEVNLEANNASLSY